MRTTLSILTVMVILTTTTGCHKNRRVAGLTSNPCAGVDKKDEDFCLQQQSSQHSSDNYERQNQMYNAAKAFADEMQRQSNENLRRMQQDQEFKARMRQYEQNRQYNPYYNR